jgi:chemosensory pili system protein ChpA (sensor histidine kinase/response regulator)
MTNTHQSVALEWTKPGILETLDLARSALEAYAGSLENGATPPADRLEDGVAALQQARGALKMLELSGAADLAEHLVALGEHLRSKPPAEASPMIECLLHGVLALPGILEEIEAGEREPDRVAAGLVNEARTLLGREPLAGPAPASRLSRPATPAVLDRFRAIGGQDKVKRIRAAYQQVLLGVLKGGDALESIDTLRKVALGMRTICEDTPHEAVWEAFDEFLVALRRGLEAHPGPLGADAVKMLRHIDAEIRTLGQDGAAALSRPVAVPLLQQLVDGAAARGHQSEGLGELRRLLGELRTADGPAISSRQALSSAAAALREELATVKDGLDLLARSTEARPDALSALIAPLKQISSTMSLLGFESSRAIVAEQVDVLQAASTDAGDPAEALATAVRALAVVDESLESLVRGGGETELITDSAKRAALTESRRGLEGVKQAVVDFVASHWDVRHLRDVPDELRRIRGALQVIPVDDAAALVGACLDYVEQELMAGHAPGWAELDLLADVVSGLDYYLERLGGTHGTGADEILAFARSSLERLRAGPPPARMAAAAEDPPEVSGYAADAMPEAEPAASAAAQQLAEAPAHRLTDSFAADAEIVGVFVEEVDEILRTVDGHLEAWRVDLADATHLAEIRRGFHTLKGGGRLVGARVLGELAWSIENMLNRVIDRTIAATPELLALVRQARQLIPGLRDAFAARQQAPHEAVERLMEFADLVASGGSPVETGEDGAEEEIPELVEADVVVAGLPPESLDLSEPATGNEALTLFMAEAREYLDLLVQAERDSGHIVDEPLLRALHNLAGSAAAAGVETLAELARAAYEVAQRFRGVEGPAALEGEVAEFVRSVQADIAGALDELASGAEPRDHLQLIAEADRLLVASDAPAADELLLTLPSVDVLMGAEVWLDPWLRSGTAGGAPAGVRSALQDVANVAASEGHQPIAALARALQDAHERLDGSRLDAPAHGTLLRAHGQLLTHIDALAAGQPLTAASDIVDTLAWLQPAPADAPEPGDTPGDGAEAEHITLAAPESVARPQVPAAGRQLVEPADTLAGLASGEIDRDLIGIFLEEADELLEALDQAIHDLAEDPDSGSHFERILRGLHTLKGGARLSGVTALGNAAHALESRLIEAQHGARAFDGAWIGSLLGDHDRLVRMVADVRALVAGVPASGPAATEPPEAAMITSAVRGARAPAREQMPVQATAVAPPKGPGEPAVISRGDLRSGSEFVRVGSALLDQLVNLAGETSIVRARVEQGLSDFGGALEEMESTIRRLKDQLRRLEIETEAQILFREERPDGPSHEEFDPLELDRYSQLQQLARSLSESASDMLDLRETLVLKAREAESLLLQQARINTELQEGLMRSRMVPFSRMLGRFRRTVRQVADELGKSVELHAYNVEGELDRSLLERMVAPLEHMLRNAVDHGIEAPEVRLAAGKPAAGRIELRLSREGGEVVIEIADDGAGIDVEQVRTKAVERGLMAADADLADDEIRQFVFAPGFSTAKSVTQISGRGVGMDVVHSEVRQLGGSISVFSQPGRGTRFAVRVPFRVSVNRALMVSVGEDLYAVPLNTIEGIVLLARDELERVYGSGEGTLLYAGVPYQMSYLGSFLGRDHRAGAAAGSVPVVLVRSGDHAVAVHVDSVQGSREIVVKSLGPQFAGVAGISGATILGDGSVVVILDLLGLIRARRSSARSGLAGRPATGRLRSVLVVDDSVTVRKVTSRLLERQGLEVTVAKDGVEAVAALQERRPDIVLLDIEMPRMDGFEVLRHIRHDERLADLPVVMISSRTGAKHRDRAASLGVSRFLGKPFQEHQLLSTLEELLE